MLLLELEYLLFEIFIYILIKSDETGAYREQFSLHFLFS